MDVAEFKENQFFIFMTWFILILNRSNYSTIKIDFNRAYSTVVKFDRFNIERFPFILIKY
jgi:hypothetical protein